MWAIAGWGSVTPPTKGVVVTDRARFALLVIAAVLLAFGLLAASAVLPGRQIGRNIAADARVLLEEPRERTWMGVEHLTDPYTDALIMNTTMIDASDPVISSLAGRNYAGTSGDARQSLVTRAENGIGPNDTYGRFWHGYAGPLRVVFSFLTYSQWRTVNTVLVWLGIVALVGVGWRRLGGAAAAIFAASLIFAAPTVVGESLQFSPVFHIAVWASVIGLYLAKGRECREFDVYLFLCAGLATSYFDLFTAPLLTLGLPLVVLLAYRVSNRTRASEPTGLTKWELTGRASGSWLIGYLAMWAAKWTYLVLAVDRDSLTDVATTATNWIGPGVGFVDRWTAMATNFEYLVPSAWWPTDVSGALAPLIVLLIVFAVLALWFALSRVAGVQEGSVPQALPLLATVFGPMAWLMVVVRHAADMAFMEYRVLLVSVAATALFFLYTVEWRTLVRRGGTGGEKQEIEV